MQQSACLVVNPIKVKKNFLPFLGDESFILRCGWGGLAGTLRGCGIRNSLAFTGGVGNKIFLVQGVGTGSYFVSI